MAKRKRYYKGKKISKGELKIAKFLESNNIKFTREQSFNGCVSMKLYPLRFDFYLKEYDLCIEFQGEHHYAPVNKGKRASIVHRKTLINDRIKREYMSRYSTKILEIPYWEYDNINSILGTFLFN